MSTIPTHGTPTPSATEGVDPSSLIRIRNLRAELAEIAADRAMALRMRPETTRGWLAELQQEERDCWDRLVKAASSAAAVPRLMADFGGGPG
jgi:hypothetical protein